MKKTPSVFLRNFDTETQQFSNSFQEPNPVADWVFQGEGVATRKYDGTCCMVKDGVLYKRREVKKGKPIPMGFIFADFDQKTGKSFGWLPVSKDDPQDKYHILAFESSIFPFEDGTYELLGEKIQGNPEKVKGYVLIKHSDAEKMYPERTFEGLKSFIQNNDIEGLVFHHEDGRMAKITHEHFGLDRFHNKGIK